MAPSYYYNDAGWRRIKAGIAELSRTIVRVGVINEHASRIHPLRSRLPVGVVARIMEFGSTRAGIPARSFLREVVYGRQKEVAEGLTAAVREVVSGSPSWKPLFDLGEKFKKYVVEQIMSGSTPPPNAPFTVEKKGHDRTLQDTMTLAESISHEAVSRTVAGSGGNETF